MHVFLYTEREEHVDNLARERDRTRLRARVTVQLYSSMTASRIMRATRAPSKPAHSIAPR